MLKHFWLLVILLLISACNQEQSVNDIASAEPAPKDSGLTLIHNARIYTVDSDFSTASSMVFDNKGEIKSVGEFSQLQEKYPTAILIDLNGATVLPGLIDSHAHLYGLALSLSQAQLQGTTGKQDVISKLHEHAKNLSPGDWLLGRGWDQNDWAVQDFPSRADLDQEFPDRPVWLRRIDGHAGWANSAALSMGDQDLSGDWQPQGGEIHRDSNGQATGILIDGAMAMVDHAVPEISLDLVQLSLDLALREMVSLGLTGVHDPGINKQIVDLYRQRIIDNNFPTRVYAMTDGAGETLDWLCQQGGVKDSSGRLIMRAAKLYIDGALGSRGAALLSDYTDDPGNSGLLFMPEQELAAMIEKVLACGFQAAVHAIGDRGNRVAIDALEAAIHKHPDNPGRHRIEHAQTLTAVDIPRLSELGIIAAMQPTHATSDMYWAAERLGDERIEYAYAWRSLLNSGARLALGSDFPVEAVNPMLGIYAAVTRKDQKGWPDGGWQASQILSREEAVRGFTIDAAYAGFMDQMVGSLAAGKRADFIVLDRDIMQVDEAEIPLIKILQTWLDGELVWQK